MINLKTATDQELDLKLEELATNAIQNEMVRHARTIEAFAIINEKNNRALEKIEFKNNITTAVVIILTVLTIFK